MGKKARSKKRRKSRPNQKEILQSSTKIKMPSFFFIIFLLSIVILGITFRVHSLGSVPARSPDEGIYTYQAKTVALQGTEGIRALIHEYNTNENMWLYPIPVRVGYIWLLATVMKMTNIMDVRAGVYVSCFFSIMSLLLLVVLGLRFFNQWVTLYALLFMSVSPVSLAIARRSWQEAMLGCVGLSLIYFCCEITRSTHRIIWYILFVAIGSYCILIKSSGVVIYGLCIAWLLWVLVIKERSLLKGALLIVFSTLGVGISVVSLVHAAGGISAVIEAFTHMKGAMATSTYARDYISGPWYHYFELLWIVSPVNTILYFVGAVGVFLFHGTHQEAAYLSINKNRSIILAIVFYMIAFMAVLFLGKKYFLNLRYVSVLIVPFYLIGGLGLWYIILFAKKIFKNFSFSIVIAGIVVIIMFAAINDYQRFKKIIVKSGIKDLSIRLLREALLIFKK